MLRLNFAKHRFIVVVKELNARESRVRRERVEEEKIISLLFCTPSPQSSWMRIAL
jgi:hypothetical protein